MIFLVEPFCYLLSIRIPLLLFISLNDMGSQSQVSDINLARLAWGDKGHRLESGQDLFFLQTKNILLYKNCLAADFVRLVATARDLFML